MSLASDILLAPLAKYFSTSEEKVFHVIKCLLAFLFLLLCDRILKAHEKSELEKRRKEKKRSGGRGKKRKEHCALHVTTSLPRRRLIFSGDVRLGTRLTLI